MKTITNIIYAVFALVALAMGTLTAQGAPGDLIAADANGNIIQLPINPSFGTPSLYWDNGNLPPHSWTGIAFDQTGNLYASDWGGGYQGAGTLWKLTPDRTGWTLFASGLTGPTGLAVDAAGNLYEADTGSGNIYKFTPGGVQSTFASGLNLTGDYRAAGTMVFDGQGNLFVPSTGSLQRPGQLPHGYTYEVSPSGAVGIIAELPDGYAPVGIGLDTSGNLFVRARNGFSNPFGNLLLIYPQGAYFGATQGNPYPQFEVGGFQLILDNANNVYLDSVGAYVYKCPSNWLSGDPVASVYVGNGYDPYETLGQLAIRPPGFSAQIQPPINADGTSVFNVRRGVVPVRFNLTQGGVVTCALPPATIAVTRTAGGTTGSIDESIYSGAADTGSNFRIDSCQYVYNLSASALGVGTYRVDIKINGQVVGSAVFQLK